MQITNVLEYLENTVKRVPDKTAYANENMEMTFGEVYHDSRAIGSYLANNNYYKEPVVVFMKSIHMLLQHFTDVFMVAAIMCL